MTIKFLLFIFFLPNLASVIYPSLPYAGQTWSVGVEEQFYLVWPVLMKKIKSKKVLMVTIIIGYLIIKLACFPIIKNFYWNNYLNAAESFFGSFSIDCMAIGGLFAVYLFNKDKILNFIFSRYTQIMVLLILIILIANGVIIPLFHYEFYGFLFGILIINSAANKKTIIKLENKTFHYLGKISYGLYMFHPLTIVISVKLLYYFNITNWILQYISAIMLTILISGISYRYFESYFIRKKIKHSVILSGENTVETPGMASVR